MSEQAFRPSGTECLRKARGLLQERGWSRTHSVEGIFGAESGPLSILEALWRGCAYGEGLCHPPAAGAACRLLCQTLGLKKDASFVEVGIWSRLSNRTEAQVIRLFDLTIRDANRRLAEAIFGPKLWSERAKTRKG